MTVRFKIILAALAVLGLALAGLTAALTAARWALDYKAPCSQPCQDMGQELDPQSNKERKIYRPKCVPLKLDLELYKPEAKANRRYTLWYKVSMKNISCCKLHLSASTFMQGLRDTQGYSYELKIWDSQGVLLKQLRHVAGGMFNEQTEFGDIAPYDDVPGTAPEFRKFSMDPDLKMDKYWFIDLNPGKAITTTPSIVKPFRAAPITRWQGDLILHGWAYYAVDMGKNRPPDPPAGFRVLDQYVFKRPGAYRIQAIWDDPGVSAEPIYPYSRFVPYTFRRFMDFLRTQGINFLPPYEVRDYHVHAESRAIEFKVKP